MRYVALQVCYTLETGDGVWRYNFMQAVSSKQPGRNLKLDTVFDRTELKTLDAFTGGMREIPSAWYEFVVYYVVQYDKCLENPLWVLGISFWVLKFEPFFDQKHAR